MVVLFSERYLPAVMPFRLALISVITLTVDFGVAFRLLGRTTVFLRSNIIGTLVNVGLLTLLLPRFGLYGAIAALALGDLIVRLYLGDLLARQTGSTLAKVIGLRSLGRVLLAALIALPLLAMPVGHGWRDIPLAAASSIAYLAGFAIVLRLLGTVEVRELLADGLTRIRTKLWRR